MRPTQIKLCGFRKAEDIRKIQGIPVDAVGFILVPGRKRTVDERELPRLLAEAPKEAKTVGVFLNPTLHEVAKWLQIASFDAIQLHGTESPLFCHWIKKRFSVQVIKTFHPTEENFQEQIEAYQSVIDIALLDHARGGTGTTYDWNLIPAFQEACQKRNIPLWVAGGITPENVRDLVEQVQPDGIDVSSGIETNGYKDEAKIRTLVERVRQYESIHT
ncbi:phosphoribosylanthranilate isomerase [Thermoflavimicrobium dichotomicum]|uniref:N-(5'-phosphoribosyl)anthranilate isomerase n=1 Tax=Thermoflavimicrobium dichotomicum TaxID=46223 RepID=A0A1I3SIK2_9BACL|nr:phosphoribosylanthranilate isomerase [Thermoflavimicrobium dichotomicum]SFJ58503.1 phosphoribosylanthranilate isomerase [Thermoflavimicrobium dichotomicum]